ncbi:hypothetical protein Misp01_29010 [Microtetraspora sp. NBRC 13810]|uniref:NPCBM/NEW2 domain-containing protein n=1 Tax=Microtetraspora sp. NBRC 13810 TaxID=3030990 RepID=UPI0024A3224F|nr:NPCBM/NEW2 domain-containing protein [Microtetraspora sp. NBRC 13810]GLW07771.1 hypothetical protein Misp01_29010 [Microtetraspora sp. NBRC 13810]
MAAPLILRADPGKVYAAVAGDPEVIAVDQDPLGVDDEVDEPAVKHGSVEFQVWADGELAARSGVVTGDQPAKKVTASVRGATFVRLVATNGVDNAYWDHADFADAKITCS